jgi:Protein of unknown function (DUF3551)
MLVRALLLTASRAMLTWSKRPPIETPIKAAAISPDDFTGYAPRRLRGLRWNLLTRERLRLRPELSGRLDVAREHAKGMIMKAALCLFAAAFVAAAIGTPAQAQNYPWCAFYTGPFQATNCGFSTYQQCMATISGIGGYCQPNTTYVPPGRRTRQQRAYPYWGDAAL